MTAKTIFCAALLAVASWSQSYLGGLRGTVLDASGKSIGDVKVTLVDEAGGGQRATISAAEGFSFSQVVPATYTVMAEAPGFKKFERKHVTVATQEIVALDLKMEIGSASESVQVTEEVPQVETSNASQGQVLDRQQLVDLPNLGRNPFMMSKLAQNVTPVGDPHYNRMEDQSGSSQISIAGGPVRGNNYLLDGIPITDAANRAIIIPTLEAVEQVKVQSNTYDAEMARTGGGMFNTYLKSGTNDLHGSLFRSEHHSDAGSGGTGQGPVQYLRRGNGAHRRRDVQHVFEIGHQRSARQPVRDHAADQLGGQQLLQQRGRHSAASTAEPHLWRQLRRPGAHSQTLQRQEPDVLLAGLGRLRRYAVEHLAVHGADGAGTHGRFLAEQNPGRRAQRDLRSAEHCLRGKHLHPAAVRRQRDSQ